MRKAKDGMSTSENNEITTAQSVVQQDLVRKNDDRGHYRLHGSLMIKLSISK